MKSITIHGLDEPLNTLLRQRAKSQGTSLNKTIKALLEEALGIRTKKKEDDRRGDFLDLFGTWSKADVQEFDRATADLESIEAADWK